MDTTLLNQFINDCDGERFPPPVAVDATCAACGVTPEEFVDAFALRVAERYASGEMDFERADALLNDLYTYYLFKYDEILPKLAWNIYLAFDAGEYHRSNDPASVDPSETYTRPEVNAILAQWRSAQSPSGG